MDQFDNDSEDQLNPHADYSIRAYEANKGAKLFEQWFEKVFCAVNPSASKDFEFSRVNFDGQEYIEVMGHNSLFTIDALESIFDGYRQDLNNFVNKQTAS